VLLVVASLLSRGDLPAFVLDPHRGGQPAQLSSGRCVGLRASPLPLARVAVHPTMHPTHDFQWNSRHSAVPASFLATWPHPPRADMMSEDAKFALGF